MSERLCVEMVSLGRTRTRAEVEKDANVRFQRNRLNSLWMQN